MKEGPEIVIDAGHPREVREDVVVRQKVLVLPPGERVEVRLVLKPMRRFHELLGMLHRQLAQHQRVDQAEDGRIGPDAQGQRQKGNGRKSRTPPHAAERIAYVLPQSFQGTPSPHLARDLLDQRPVAKLPAGGCFGRLRILPSFDAIPRGHGQMGPNLLVQLPVAASAAEPQPHAHAWPSLSPGCMRLAMAALNWFHRPCSAVSCLLPAAVS